MAQPRQNISALRSEVLRWYDRHRRSLPWRVAPGAVADPYAVWLSEIMLQQTTVATVAPYFTAFMSKWPTVVDLAKADLDEILVAWQGLGYYARARNMHKCASVVATEHGGVFPKSPDELIKLPGIGPYTAAAIAAIAFDHPVVPVDGNIERVTARVFAVDTPLPDGKKDIAAAAAGLAGDDRPGDFAQAMMDLGATVCTPAAPTCVLCPLMDRCQARKRGVAADLPIKAPKKARPDRRAVIFWLTDPEGRVLMRRRPERGLLGGMMEFPSTPWTEDDWPTAERVEQYAPAAAEWQLHPGEAQHIFTHFRLTVRVLRGETDRPEKIDGVWIAASDFADFALPTAMKKVVALIRA